MNFLQTHFAHSTLGEAFDKQTKVIEEQEEKQIEETEDNKKQLVNKQPGNNEFLLSKQRNIFKNIFDKRLNKIDELSKKIDYDDQKFIVNSIGLEIDLGKLKDPAAFLDSIKK